MSDLAPPIHSEGGEFLAEADLAWPEARMIVELDGWQWHGRLRKDFEKGCLRERRLELEGWFVHRFLWSDVVSRPVEIRVRPCERMAQLLRILGVRPVLGCLYSLDE
ncbi:MAG: DUF559 domain-containing protein [Myxococcaceae bacterium]